MHEQPLLLQLEEISRRDGGVRREAQCRIYLMTDSTPTAPQRMSGTEMRYEVEGCGRGKYITGGEVSDRIWGSGRAAA